MVAERAGGSAAGSVSCSGLSFRHLLDFDEAEPRRLAYVGFELAEYAAGAPPAAPCFAKLPALRGHQLLGAVTPRRHRGIAGVYIKHHVDGHRAARRRDFGLLRDRCAEEHRRTPQVTVLADSLNTMSRRPRSFFRLDHGRAVMADSPVRCCRGALICWCRRPRGPGASLLWVTPRSQAWFSRLAGKSRVAASTLAAPSTFGASYGVSTFRPRQAARSPFDIRGPVRMAPDSRLRTCSSPAFSTTVMSCWRWTPTAHADAASGWSPARPLASGPGEHRKLRRAATSSCEAGEVFAPEAPTCRPPKPSAVILRQSVAPPSASWPAGCAGPPPAHRRGSTRPQHRAPRRTS